MANIFCESAKISKLSSIEISNRGTNTHIGSYSTIDDFVKIKHVGGKGSINIGENVHINSGCVLYSGNGIKIGNDVLIGPNCSLVPVNHEFKDPSKSIRNQGFQKSRGGIIIEDDVWIGANVTILDGAKIRKGCIIGANSIVNRELNEYTINFGSPIKEIRSRK